MGDAVATAISYARANETNSRGERFGDLKNLRRANSICTIQHPDAKYKPITLPPCLVLPLFPHKIRSRISLACLTRHNRTHHDRDKATCQDQEQPHIRDRWQCSICKHDNCTGYPCNHQIHDEHVPPLICVSRVEQPIHGDDLVREDGRHGRGAEEPTEEIPPAREVSNGPPIFSASY